MKDLERSCDAWRGLPGKDTILFYYILGCVLPLQEVALRQSSIFLCPLHSHPHSSLLPHNVISPTTFWSSDYGYGLCKWRNHFSSSRQIGPDALCTAIPPSVSLKSDLPHRIFSRTGGARPWAQLRRRALRS